jgi:glycosyltransferase
MAGTEDMVPVIAGAGLPAVSMTDRTMRDCMFTSRDGTALALPADPAERMRFGGHGFGRLASYSLDALTGLCTAWRPDVIIGGTLSFAAALLAAQLGIPYVRHAWDMGEPAEMDLGALDELMPQLGRLGLREMPKPDLWLHICPPSVLAPDAPAGLPMRYVPAGRQQRLEPWMYTRSPRRRVCVTAGSRVSQEHEIDFLDGLAGKVGGLDVDIAIAAPEEVATVLAARRPEVRAGWLPLDTVLATCDVIVHSGGGQTALTAISAGVPQLLVPNMPKLIAPAQRLSGAGAAITLLPGEGTEDAIAAACQEILSTPSYRERAAALATEMAALPGPAEILKAVEGLVPAP